jgi:hypothetical protein
MTSEEDKDAVYDVSGGENLSCIPNEVEREEREREREKSREKNRTKHNQKKGRANTKKSPHSSLLHLSLSVSFFLSHSQCQESSNFVDNGNKTRGWEIWTAKDNKVFFDSVRAVGGRYISLSLLSSPPSPFRSFAFHD